MANKVLSREKNVLGGELLACSYDPLTGYFRDGCCATHENVLKFVSLDILKKHAL